MLPSTVTKKETMNQKQDYRASGHRAHPGSGFYKQNHFRQKGEYKDEKDGKVPDKP